MLFSSIEWAMKTSGNRRRRGLLKMFRPALVWWYPFTMERQRWQEPMGHLCKLAGNSTMTARILASTFLRCPSPTRAFSCIQVVMTTTFSSHGRFLILLRSLSFLVDLDFFFLHIFVMRHFCRSHELLLGHIVQYYLATIVNISRSPFQPFFYDWGFQLDLVF